MAAGGKRRGAGRPKGSRALTLLAPTGERMSFHEAARQYDKKALQVIASILMDENQPASLRLAAANDLRTVVLVLDPLRGVIGIGRQPANLVDDLLELLDRAYGRPPVAIDTTAQDLLRRQAE